MKLRPIPAFYCCYLLRSTVRHASHYIGSTLHPHRRLGQHNGLSQGGARRTAKASLRPWEMTCIVTGFPSQIAALQFEWAWKNSHLTRKIPDEQRISIRTASARRTKTGRVRKTPASLQESLARRLSNMSLLLHVPSFARWPLELRFFCEDVYKIWQKCSTVQNPPTQRVIKVTCNFEPQNGVAAIDPTYLPIKSHVEIGQLLKDHPASWNCACCNAPADPRREMLVICPRESCKATSHVACLSQEFLRAEAVDEVLPVEGQCPSCKSTLKWVDLVRELSLRMRGEKEIERLMKRRRKKGRGRVATLEDALEDEDDENLDFEELDDESLAEDIIDEPHKQELAGFKGGDDWESSSDSSLASGSIFTREAGIGPRDATEANSRLPIVIQDSDGWEDMEVLE